VRWAAGLREWAASGDGSARAGAGEELGRDGVGAGPCRALGNGHAGDDADKRGPLVSRTGTNAAEPKRELLRSGVMRAAMLG